MKNQIGALALFAVFGCVNSNPTLYLLETESIAAGSTTMEQTVGVREIRLPDYAKDVRFVERDPKGALTHQEAHRWADRPTRAMTRALVGYLRDLTGTTVVSEPYPAGLLPDLTLTVELDVLDGRRNDSVRLRGRYRLRSPQGLSFHDVLLEEPVTGDTFSDVTAAYGKLLAALATRIHQDALIKLQ